VGPCAPHQPSPVHVGAVGADALAQLRADDHSA
jgi:hypothetical protein